MFIFNRLYAENFHSFQTLDFQIQPGKFLILGRADSFSTSSNGAGKSSIFDVLQWTLFKLNRDSDPSHNRNGNCVTKVFFNKGNDFYEITRYFKHQTKGNSVEICVNSELLSFHKQKTQEEEISRILEVESEAFLCSTIIQQGFPMNFTQFTPTQRKLLIENLIGVTIWTEYQKKFQVSSKETELKLKEILEESKNQNNELIRIATQKNAITELNLETIKEELTLLKQKKEIIETELDKLKFDTNTLNNIRMYLKKIEQVKSQIQLRLKALSQILAKTICPECGQPYPKNRLDVAAKEKIALEDKLGQAENRTKEQEKTLKNLESLEQKNIVLKSQLQNTINLITEKEKKLLKSQTNLIDTEEKEKIIKEKLNYLETKIQELEHKKKCIEYLIELMHPSSDFRTQVLKYYLHDLNHILQETIKYFYSDVDIQITYDDSIEIKIIKNQNIISYKSLSGGEKRRFDIAVFFALQKWKMNQSGFRTNYLVFDEIFDGLDVVGIDTVLSVMEHLFSQQTSIYVITHNENLKPNFSNLIIVEKLNGVSRLT